TMVNATGQTVYSSAVSGFVGKFNRRIGKSGLPSGMYLLQIRHGKEFFVKKVMVSL
ncbi:MAG: T9SS type A sorting domain-containing protein, partial [Chitinophagaceae bacterium]